jgi:hypothetical protein
VLRLPHFLTALVLLLVAACADVPTSPHPRSADQSGPASTIALPPMGEPVCQFGGTYPYCWDEPNPPPPEPDPSCSNAWACNGGGSGGGSGGGGGDGGGQTSPPPTDEPEECDPRADPVNCHVPLRESDRDLLHAVQQEYWKPLSEISDPAARAQCREMRDSFATLMASGKVFRGGYDTQLGQHPEPHWGLFDAATGEMHYDPATLDLAIYGDVTARRQMAKTSLHEAAHARGHLHGRHDGAGNYAEAPFNLLSAGPNSCLK